MRGAYYSENDPFAAEWLRRLIIFGHVAPGEVDERSIEDVTPDDLRGFAQHHFFAGIGVWSKALRDAGWSDDRPVWTGSCPCQPFSAAGKGLGFADERHLWPAWAWLIGQHRPDIVLGEQVESPAGWAWLDLVSTDVEGAGYAFGAVGFPAAGVGAPHRRDRLYWLARAHAVANTPHQRCEGRLDPLVEQHSETGGLLLAGPGEPRRFSLADTDAERRGRGSGVQKAAGSGRRLSPEGNSRWDPTGWVHCRDPGGSKWRPVEPGSLPLAHGAPARVGRLRGYGNALVKPQAQAFVETVMEAL